MKTLTLYTFLLFLTLFVSCKKTEVSEFTDTPILEAYLNPGDYFNVTLSHQIPFSSTAQFASEDLYSLNSVQVNYNNSAHTLIHLGGGKYIDSSIIVQTDAKYNLSFTFNKKSVTAYTFIPPKPINYTESVSEITLQKVDSTTNLKTLDPAPDPIQLLWNNTDASNYLVVVENIETNPVPIRVFKGGRLPSTNRFKKTPTNSSGIQIRSNEFQYFGNHRLILFHVLPDYATLYNQNSTSSQNLTNPSTSIVNGYGIFTGLNSDTLILNVKQK